MNILLLEDEYSLRISIKEYLTDEGFLVDDFRNGEDALNAVYSKTYDILLLDIKVPKKSGMDMLSELREAKISTPVIFISSITDMEQLEKSYQAGCCDYVRKPFELKELYLRIMQAFKSNILKTAEEYLELPLGYRFDVKTMILSKESTNVALTKKEALIIALLVENLGSVVTIDDFQSYVWGEDIDPTNVRVQINNLRKKLDGDLVVNVRGFGYKIDKNS
jgi:two-component system, OmpR family, response regulator